MKKGWIFIFVTDGHPVMAFKGLHSQLAYTALQRMKFNCNTTRFIIVLVAGGLGGGLGDLGGPHGMDQASLTYAGNVAEQGGYLAAGGLGGLAGIGPYGTGGVGSAGGAAGTAGAVAGAYGGASDAGGALNGVGGATWGGGGGGAGAAGGAGGGGGLYYRYFSL